jgi:ATP-dependent Clp protease ATP-binding subunit ClpA
MFERFTERARMVVVLAQEDSRELRHSYIGTEHLLLGLLREQEGYAARVLESMGVTHQAVRDQVVAIVGMGEEGTSGQIPFTPRAKKSLELALREAMGLGHNYIGTEHLLLGLLQDKASVAIRILLDADATPERIRAEVLKVIATGPPPRMVPVPASRSPTAPWLAPFASILDELAPEIRRKHGREPDSGDLLIVLASAYADAVELDKLQDAVERRRHEDEERRADITAQARRRLGLGDG